jgi:hypothetical protein
LERAAREDNAIAANVNIKPIMDSWAYQKGYPVIHVTRNDEGVVTVTQVRNFFAQKTGIQIQKFIFISGAFLARKTTINTTTVMVDSI